MATINFDAERDQSGATTGKVVVSVIVDPKLLKQSLMQIADESNRRKQMHRALIHTAIGILQMGDMAVSQTDEEIATYAAKMRDARPVGTNSFQNIAY